MSLFEQLSSISTSYEKAASTHTSQWKGSPFEWVLLLPSRSKGAYGEKFVQELFRTNGFDVKRPKSGSDHDRVINGHRIEIKMSTLWATNNQYKFQQIRNQEYDYLICLGLSPNEAHAWLIPKEEVHVRREGVSHQHGGKAGNDTLWLNFNAGQPPAWLSSYGGSLEEVVGMLKSKQLGSHPGRALTSRDKIITHSEGHSKK